MRRLTLLCSLLVGLGFGSAAEGQARSETSDLQIMLKKPGGSTKVGNMSSVKVCPIPRSSSAVVEQRVITRDGAVYGLGGSEGARTILRCRAGKVEWAVGTTTQSPLAVDSAGTVYTVSDAPGQPAKKFLGKTTSNGRPEWVIPVESNGSHLGISVKPQPGTPGTFYVFGITPGTLKNQPASSKGKPFVIKFNALVDRVWTTHIDAVGAHPYFDVDSKGNAYALTIETKAPRIGRLTKLSPSGTVLSSQTLKLKKGSLPVRVDGLHVDSKSRDVYVFARAQSLSDAYAVIKINADGKLGWARALRMSHQGGGGEEHFRGAGVHGDTLYVFRTYGYEADEQPEGMPDDQYEMLAMAHKTADGRPKWVQSEWYSSLDESDTGTLGDVFILPDKIAMPASAAVSFKIGRDGKPVLPKPQATLPPPNGDFSSFHEITIHEEGKEDTVEVGDNLTITQAPNKGLQIKLNVVAANFSECSFEGAMHPVGPNEWRHAKAGSACVVSLTHAKDKITIESNWECKTEWCGAGSTLDGTFPTSSRKPAGSYKWPQR